jgi:hypothetical protein
MFTPSHNLIATAKSTAAQIRKQIKADAIYWFSYHKTNEASDSVLFPQMEQDTEKAHFGLLVFAAEIPQNFIADTTESIRQQSAGTCTVTLLVCETAAIQCPGQHQWLLHNIMTEGFRLYRRRSRRALLHFTETPGRNTQKIEKYWNQRKYIATCFLEAENAIENPNGDTVQVALMHQALEQLCLGLIYVFLGHRPDNFGLAYLLGLCDVFTPLATEIFPQATEHDQRLLRVLSANHHTLRHKPQKQTSITDVEVLRSRVNDFLDRAVSIAESEIERLSAGKIEIENESAA